MFYFGHVFCELLKLTCSITYRISTLWLCTCSTQYTNVHNSSRPCAPNIQENRCLFHLLAAFTIKLGSYSCLVWINSNNKIHLIVCMMGNWSSSHLFLCSPRWFFVTMSVLIKTFHQWVFKCMISSHLCPLPLSAWIHFANSLCLHFDLSVLKSFKY